MKRVVILNLVLKKKWFDLIATGYKRAEYRAIKKYWKRVFGKGGIIKIKGKIYNPKEVVICFSLGYKKDRKQIFVDCEGVRTGKGIKAWGAPAERVYIIKLGKILSRGQVAKLILISKPIHQNRI